MIGIIIAIIALVALLFIFIPGTNNQDNQNTQADNPSIINLPDQSPTAVPATPPISNPTQTVEIKSSGFSPQTLQIKQGNRVIFLNKDTSPHWPASAVHPTHTVYPGSSITKCGTNQQSTIFDACKGLSQGESFIFTFNEKGTWKYHDHLNPSSTGTIVVS